MKYRERGSLRLDLSARDLLLVDSLQYLGPAANRRLHEGLSLA